jgi:hypothetical protein
MRHAGELLQNRGDLLLAEDYGQPFRSARAHDGWNSRDIDREVVLVQKDRRGEGLILRRCTDPTINRQSRRNCDT